MLPFRLQCSPTLANGPGKKGRRPTQDYEEAPNTGGAGASSGSLWGDADLIEYLKSI
jgi:hypothetical protein